MHYGVDLFLIFSAFGMAWQRCFVLFCWVSGMPVTDRRASGIYKLAFERIPQTRRLRMRLQPVLGLELVPRFIQRAKHRRGNHADLGRRVLRQLQEPTMSAQLSLPCITPKLTLSGCVLAMAFI